MNTIPSDVKTLSVKGQDFDYLDLGSGRPVIFMHGVLGDLRTFTPHAEMLSDRYRTITYTQRYFGNRAWPEGGPPFGIETHAEDLVGFVEALGIGPVFLVAWSYAGHAGLRAAQIRPDLFRAMFVYETGFQTFLTDPAEIAAFKADLELMFGPVFAAVNAGDNEKAARLLVNASAQDEYYFESRTELQMQVELENAAMMPKLLAQTPPPRITTDDLTALQVPISIACGAKSRPSYKLVSEAAMRILPGPHYMIPGVNHFWPDAEPNAFSGFVGEWLDAQA
ncbi:MAG: alpha/beta hydrolase [Rhizobium sp.]|nr:alpha/beta hydrolase [Rhizobium sp.]